MSKQAAAAIRKSLKAQGITARQVSVRSDASSVTCVIKDPAVRLDDVEGIARQHERVDRDHMGCILRGGNTFIRVEYSDNVLDPIAERIEPQLTAIEHSEEPGIIRDIEGLDVWFCDSRFSYGGNFHAAPKGWAGDAEGNGYVRPKEFHGASNAARQIAIMVLNGAPELHWVRPLLTDAYTTF